MDISAESIERNWIEKGGHIDNSGRLLVSNMVRGYNSNDPEIVAKMITSVMNAITGLAIVGDKDEIGLIQFAKKECENNLAQDKSNVLFRAEMDRPSSFGELYINVHGRAFESGDNEGN